MQDVTKDAVPAIEALPNHCGPKGCEHGRIGILDKIATNWEAAMCRKNSSMPMLLRNTSDTRFGIVCGVGFGGTG
jgi:hypothetical protein